ncbi:MAG: response regulator [Methanomassiliicoccus sp.]|nr:response regulator [Methanomassiliicoccus sp.]
MGRPFRILLVEDNPADAHLFSCMLRDLDLDLSIIVAGDGSQALSILAGGYGGCQASAPDLVILDLNLPKVHGYDVLSFLKSGPLRSVPVVVLTGSLNREDEVRARSMDIIGYIIKPSTAEEYDAILAQLRSTIETRLRIDTDGRKCGGPSARPGGTNGAVAHGLCPSPPAPDPGTLDQMMWR